MGKSRFHKPEKAMQTLAAIQSMTTLPESNFLQDASVARQLLSPTGWKDDFEVLLKQLDILKSGDEASCLAALHKLISDKGLIAAAISVESLTEQLTKELHNSVLRGSTAQINVKRGTTASPGSSKKNQGKARDERNVRKLPVLSSEQSDPAVEEENERDAHLKQGSKDPPKILEKEGEVKQPEKTGGDVNLAPKASSPLETQAGEHQPAEAAATMTPLERLEESLKVYGGTIKDLRSLDEQSAPREIYEATPSVEQNSPLPVLVGSSKAFALLDRLERLDIAPIFIPSRGRADYAHLNLSVPWLLGEKEHLVLITVEPSDVSV